MPKLAVFAFLRCASVTSLMSSCQILVELAGLEHDKYAVRAEELAQILAAAVVVDAHDIEVEPHLAAAERRLSVLLEREARHLVLRSEERR